MLRCPRIPYSGQKHRSTATIASFNEDGNDLTVTGYKLDIIALISSIWEQPLEDADLKTFRGWADVFTGGKAAEIADLPFQPESGWKGLRTTPYSTCDFWLRVSRSPRFKATDTLDPFTSDHPAQQDWRHNTYRRHRTRSRGVVLTRDGVMSLTLWYSWLALMLPYASVGRRVAATCDGFFLLVPPETRPDDLVYFLEGGGTLGYVLRRREGLHACEFIGAAYVHGFFGTRLRREGSIIETLHIR